MARKIKRRCVTGGLCEREGERERERQRQRQRGERRESGDVCVCVG